MLRYVSVSDEVQDGLRVARRSRSGSDVRECASRMSQMNASFDTIKERERECSEGKDFTNAELLKKRLGNVSERELWFRTVGELLVILLRYVQRFFILLGA